MTKTPQVLVDGLAFGEGPRWRDGRLWFSDMHAHAVLAVDLEGNLEKIVDVPTWPSGLGWLPDGRLLVVSMTDRKLLRQEPHGTLAVHADLSGIATWHCNDMVVDARGNAYVGNFGFDLHGGASPAPATLALVRPDGRVEPAADDLMFPNGTVLTPDGATLIVGETFASRLTAFDIAPDGTLSGRREFASIAPNIPDGICLDEEGAIWSADPRNNVCIRVAEGGAVTDRIETDRGCYACMLGGPDRRTLFLLTSKDASPDTAAQARSGRIETVEVKVPGAGLP